MIGDLNLDPAEATLRNEPTGYRIRERWYLDISYMVSSEDVRKREEFIPRVKDILASMVTNEDKNAAEQ